MPTAIPARSEIATAAPRLPRSDTARLLIILARVRWLNRQLEATHRRVERYGIDIPAPIWFGPPSVGSRFTTRSAPYSVAPRSRTSHWYENR